MNNITFLNSLKTQNLKLNLFLLNNFEHFCMFFELDPKVVHGLHKQILMTHETHNVPMALT